MYPTFHGRHEEDAQEFLDKLEMGFLMNGKHQDQIKARAFTLVLREEAHSWYKYLDANVRNDLGLFKRGICRKV